MKRFLKWLHRSFKNIRWQLWIWHRTIMKKVQGPVRRRLLDYLKVMYEKYNVPAVESCASYMTKQERRIYKAWWLLYAFVDYKWYKFPQISYTILRYGTIPSLRRVVK